MSDSRTDDEDLSALEISCDPAGGAALDAEFMLSVGHDSATLVRRLGRAMNDREQRVRECAYFLWEEEKCPDGRAQIHWQMAEIAITLVDYLKASQQERTAEPVSAQSISSTFQPVLEGRAFTDPPHFPWKNHSGSTCGS